MPLVLATAFSLSCPSWKTVFSVGRSSSPNTQLNHCTWPSALRGHHWLSYCQIQGHLPVLTLWISLKDRTCLMTHCFTKLSVLLVYILLLSYCFPPIFLTFPFLFCFFQWTHSVLSIPQMMTLPSVSSEAHRGCAHPVHTCSLSSGRFDFLLALPCPEFGHSSWLMAIFTNSGHKPTTKYLCLELQK